MPSDVKDDVIKLAKYTCELQKLMKLPQKEQVAKMLELNTKTMEIKLSTERVKKYSETLSEKQKLENQQIVLKIMVDNNKC